MRDAIKRALEKNKDERFSSVTEFFEAMTGGAAMPATTSVMNQAPGHDAHVADAVPAGGNRAKTEMGAPVAMDAGPPAGAMTPPYGPPMGGPPMGAPPPGGPAVVPQGPTHTPAKKGGNGLIIGLAAVAVLLIGGGGLAYALRGKPKPVPTTDSRRPHRERDRERDRRARRERDGRHDGRRGRLRRRNGPARRRRRDDRRCREDGDGNRDWHEAPGLGREARAHPDAEDGGRCESVRLRARRRHEIAPPPQASSSDAKTPAGLSELV